MSIINPGLYSPFARVNREAAWFLVLKIPHKPCDWKESLKGDDIQGFLTSSIGMLQDLGVRGLLIGYMLINSIYFLVEKSNHRGTTSCHAQDFIEDAWGTMVVVECTWQRWDAWFYCGSYTISVTLLVCWVVWITKKKCLFGRENCVG